MNINSTEIKNETVNENINLAEVPTPRTPLVACNSGDPLKVSPSPSLKVSEQPSLPVFIKTPEVFSRQGELLTPEHPDYAGILAIITRELSERFQNGDTALAHFFAPPAAPTSSQPLDPPALAPASPAEVSPSPSLKVSEPPIPDPPLKVSESHSLKVSDSPPSLIVSDSASPPSNPALALELAPAPAPQAEVSESPSLTVSDSASPTQSEICEASQPTTPLKVSEPHSLKVSDTPPSLTVSDGQGGTGDSPVAAGNLPGASDQSKIKSHAKRKSCTRQRVGKIAKLPPNLQAYVNEQMLRHAPYGDICRHLAEQGFPGINASNLSSWKSGGFDDFLAQRESLVEREYRMKTLVAMARENGCRFDLAALQVFVSHSYEAMRYLDPKALAAYITKHPDSFFKLNTGLSNLVKACKGFPGFSHACRPDKALSSQTTGPRPLKRGLTLEERDQVCQSVGILPPQPDPQSEPETNS